MLKRKINIKFLLALGIMLIAVFILNVGTVNATTDEDYNAISENVPTTVTEEQNAKAVFDKLNLQKNESNEYVFIKYYELGDKTTTPFKELQEYFSKEGYEFTFGEGGYGGRRRLCI